MKRSIIIGNWKMYATSSADAHVLATSVRNGVASVPNLEVVLCPPSIWLSEIANILKRSTKVALGAQNVADEAEGAFTGEISVLMVKEMADYAIIGHSERREYFGESDFDVNEKVLLALRAGLTPIICVGEKKRKSHPTEPIKQLEEALSHVPRKYLNQIIVAYEPIWAIGTGENAEPEYVRRVATLLREQLHRDTPILYGGSVNSQNIAGYAAEPELDGALIGGASVKAAEFIKICKTWSESRIITKNE
ncbi:MAG TPA: triose-phosphate isomerase [bacterium]|nr:triose-phosphate isomerase [bacterium]